MCMVEIENHYVEDQKEYFTAKLFLLPFVAYLWSTFSLLVFSSVHLELLKHAFHFGKIVLMVQFKQVQLTVLQNEYRTPVNA